MAEIKEFSLINKVNIEYSPHLNRLQFANRPGRGAPPPLNSSDFWRIHKRPVYLFWFEIRKRVTDHGGGPGVFVAKNADYEYTDALTEFRKYMGWRAPKYRIRARQILAEALAELGYRGVDLFVAGRSCCVLVLSIEKASQRY